jgi:uncharacterized protein YodC (DUF2158 family)
MSTKVAEAGFAIGDKVKLKSGGPVAMTVAGIEQDTGKVICDWTDLEGVAQRHAYPAVCLKRAG